MSASTLLAFAPPRQIDSAFGSGGGGSTVSALSCESSTPASIPISPAAPLLLGFGNITVGASGTIQVSLTGIFQPQTNLGNTTSFTLLVDGASVATWSQSTLNQASMYLPFAISKLASAAAGTSVAIELEIVSLTEAMDFTSCTGYAWTF